MTAEPAKYTFNQINIGLQKNFSITITESMVEDFANLSGDFSPIIWIKIM